MSRYLRPRLPGVPVFFTVALAQRGGRLLVDQVEGLRDAVQVTRAERPFGIEAWVVLPDHLHCIWVRRARKKVHWTFFSAERAERGAGGGLRLWGAVGWHPTACYFIFASARLLSMSLVNA